MKYVVALDNYEEESPIMFPECFQHNAVATMKLRGIVSAGFCNKVDGKWEMPWKKFEKYLS